MHGKSGFPGQRLRVLPTPVVSVALSRPGVAHLLVTDAGFYPHASGHAKERPAGINQCIVLVCVAGSGLCTVDGVEHRLRTGHCAVIPPRVAHSYRADPLDPWTLWWVHLLGRDLDELMSAGGMTAERPVRLLSEVYRSAELIEHVLNSMEGGETPANLLAASGAAWHLMTLLMANQAPAAASVSIIDQARDHIVAHPESNSPVKDLAAMADLSPSHFSALFRERVGTSVIRYRDQVRMGRARELLDTTRIPVAKVGSQVGYEDAFYFSRRFKAIHGVTPQEYRAQAKG